MSWDTGAPNAAERRSMLGRAHNLHRMGTLVCFHAHPDDESIATSGTMAKAHSLGHRVVLVVATRGENGEPVPGILKDGEQLGLRRTAEVYESGRLIGVDRIEFLGYVDSGMDGTVTSEAPWCFARADVDQAAARLAVILGEEAADAITIYDDHGGYGHPDHIQVHKVGRRAAELIGLEQVYEATMNRTMIVESMQDRLDELPEGVEAPDIDNESFGTAEENITHKVDVSDFLATKKSSMKAHRSQIPPDHFLVAMPDDVFAIGMGTEWFIGEGPAPDAGTLAAELFEPMR
jgi:LmbE family N-acetylglucosaminyl deacetylase